MVDFDKLREKHALEKVNIDLDDKGGYISKHTELILKSAFMAVAREALFTRKSYALGNEEKAFRDLDNYINKQVKEVLGKLLN